MSQLSCLSLIKLRHRIKTQKIGVFARCAVAYLATAIAATAIADSNKVSEQTILITINHDSQQEAAAFNGFNRNNVARRDYQSVISAKRIMRQIVADYNLEDLNQGWQIDSLGIYCGVFRGNSKTDVTQLLEQLNRDGRIDSAQKMFNYAVLASLRSPEHAFGHFSENQKTLAANAEYSPADLSQSKQPRRALNYNDTYFKKQYGDRRQVVEAMHKKSTGKGVRIALIDTGLDVRHQEFQGRRLATANFVDNDQSQFKRDKHGTAVAGIIAAKPNNGIGIVGLAPDAKITAIKACWHDESTVNRSARCNSLTLSAALDRAIQIDSQLINMSLAGPSDPLVSRLIRVAKKKGAILIAADPMQGKLRFPATMEEVLAVVNVPSTMQSTEANVETANLTLRTLEHGFYVSGNEVLSTSPGGHFDFYSGSSVSAARTTALLAHSLALAPEQDWASRLQTVADLARELGMR